MKLILELYLRVTLAIYITGYNENSTHHSLYNDLKMENSLALVYISNPAYLV